MPVGPDRAARPTGPQSTLASAGRAALLPATVAMEPPPEMSSIEPVASGAGGRAVRPAPGSEPAPAGPDAAARRRPGAGPGARGDRRRRDGHGAVPPRRRRSRGRRRARARRRSPSPSPVPAPRPSRAAGRGRRPAEPPRPEDLWRDGVRQLASLARARLEQSPAASGSPWGLRARVLAWLAEPDIDPDLGQHEADGVRAVLRALDDAPAESPRRGDEVRAAVLVLEDQAPLEIVDLRLCSKVERFGDFEPFEPPVRKAGQPVILYCEVDGLRFEPTSAGFRTRLAAQLEILPEGGGPPILTRSLGTAEETCRRRRRDYYVAYKLVLPRPLAARRLPAPR